MTTMTRRSQCRNEKGQKRRMRRAPVHRSLTLALDEDSRRVSQRSAIGNSGNHVFFILDPKLRLLLLDNFHAGAEQ